jgi:AraC family transcriptional regulator
MEPISSYRWQGETQHVEPLKETARVADSVQCRRVHFGHLFNPNGGSANASMNPGGIPFAIAETDTADAIAAGPVYMACDVISVATRRYSMVVAVAGEPEPRRIHLEAGAVLLLSRGTSIRSVHCSGPSSSLNLCLDLDEVTKALAWRPLCSQFPQLGHGRVDPFLLDALRTLLDEAKGGFPSGSAWTDAACISVIARCAATIVSAEGASTMPLRVTSRLNRCDQLRFERRVENRLACQRLKGGNVKDPLVLSLSALRHAQESAPDHGVQTENQLPADSRSGRSLIPPSLSRIDVRKVMSLPIAPSVQRKQREVTATPCDCGEHSQLRRGQIWTGPPVEPVTLWQQMNADSRPDASWAVVYWAHSADMMLRGGDLSTRYQPAERTIDVLPAGWILESSADGENAADAWKQHASVIPLDAARLALVGVLPPRLEKPILQIKDHGLSQVIELYQDTWNATQTPTMERGRSVAAILVSMLTSRMGWSAHLPTRDALTGSQRELVWQWVTARLGNLTTADLLSQLPLSRQSFADAFKVAFGTTLRQFTLDRMIDTSRWLLVQTNSPLTDIAMEVGFASPSHFSTTFAARVGCAPRTYRAAFATSRMNASSAAGDVKNR